MTRRPSGTESTISSARTVVAVLSASGRGDVAMEITGRVPEPGEPRAAGSAGRDQGLGRDRAERRASAGPGRDAPVFSDHQRGRPIRCAA